MRGFLDNLIGGVSTGLNKAAGFLNDYVIPDPSGQRKTWDQKTQDFYNDNPPVSPLAQPIQAQDPSVNQVESPQEYQPQNLDDLVNKIQGGMNKGFGDSPMASMAGEMAQTGKRLADSTQGKVDPLIAAIIALKESGGGKNTSTPEANNPYNIKLGGVVDYPDLKTAIQGGNGKQGFEGLLREGGLYQDFRDSGDMGQFFKKYTPVADPLNPGIGDQVQQYNQLRALFE